MEHTAVLDVVCTVLAVLTTVLYSYQILFLWLPMLLRRKKAGEGKQNRYAVLIAARNEEAVLPHLLESIRGQDYPGELVDTFVIADNCTDHTAQVAGEYGATVFTRFHKTRIGKGYALNYLLEQMRRTGCLEQYDAFLVFDADNLLEPDYITKINALPSQGYPVFCGYRNTKNFSDNWISSGYALWHLHESTHMNRSRMGAGVSCLTSGTGFGFTRQVLEQLGGWNFFTLTEDTEFNNWCIVNGIKIGYCHDAVLYDEQPITFSQSWKQRTRWAQGGFQVLYRYFPRLSKGLFRGSWSSWSCFEYLTLLPSGYLFSVATFLATTLQLVLTQPPLGVVTSLLSTLGSAYLTLFVIGAVTLGMEWHRVRASTRRKLSALLTFPLFMLTYVPIAITAIFSKFRWEPIHHTVAISAKELLNK